MAFLHMISWITGLLQNQSIQILSAQIKHDITLKWFLEVKVNIPAPPQVLYGEKCWYYLAMTLKINAILKEKKAEKSHKKSFANVGDK